MNSIVDFIRNLISIPIDFGDREILIKSLLSAALKLAGAVIALALTAVLSRTLGPEGLGIYILAFTIIAILAVPANFGLASLVLRETSSAKQDQDWPRLRGLLRKALQAVATYSGTILIVAGLGLTLFDDVVSPALRTTIMLALLVQIFWSISEVFSASLRGLGHVIAGQFSDMIFRPMLLCIFILATLQFYGPSSVTPSWAMTLHIVAAVISVLVVLILIKKNLPTTIKGSASYQTRSWLVSLGHLSLLSGVMVINGYTDILMLGLLATPEQVGLYRIAAQSALLVSFTLTAANVAISPSVVRLYNDGDLVQLQSLLTNSARIVLFTSLPVAFLFIFFSRELLGFIFGEVFTESAGALLILTAGQIINAALGSVSLVLNMIGLERYTVRGSIIAALLNVGLNSALIPFMGINGAATGTALSLAFWNIYLVRQLYRQTNLLPSPILPKARAR